MEITVLLMRNGLPEGSLEQERMGMISSPLLNKEKERISSPRLCNTPPIKLVYVSPTAQCIETAQLMFPNIPAIMMDKLSPLDMGELNGRTREEVMADKRFAEWSHQEQVRPLGNGEQPYYFRTRCALAFRQVVKEMNHKGITGGAVFTHQSVISAILQRFHQPRTYYMDWSIGYGEGYKTVFHTDSEGLQIKEKLFCQKVLTG